MRKLNQQYMIAVLVLTGLSVAVGCGDGTRHKATLRRSLPGTPGSLGNQKPGQLQGSHGGQGATTGSQQGPVNTKTTADTDAKAKEIDSAMAQAVHGETISDASKIPPGTYVISSITTSFKTMPVSSFAGVYQETELNPQGNGQFVTQPGTPISYGIMNDSDSGRVIKIPTTFTAKSGALDENDDASTTMVLNTRAEMQGTSLSLNQSFSDLAVKSNAFSLLPMINGHVTTTPDGKPAQTALVRMSDGTLKIQLSITENEIDAKNAKPSNAKQGSTYRTLIFAYKLQAAKDEANPPTNPAANPAAAADTPAPSKN